MIFKTAKAALNPYLLWIKLGFIALVFLGGLWTGCDYKEGRNNKELQQEKDNVAYYQGQAKVTNEALVAMSKQAQANAAQAEKQMALAQKEKERADANKALIAKQEKEQQKELEEAFNNPDCKKVLEQKLCPLIKDF